MGDVGLAAGRLAEAFSKEGVEDPRTQQLVDEFMGLFGAPANWRDLVPPP